MRTIHDDDPGSQGRERRHEPDLAADRHEALARRKDELEMVLATSGIGYCRLDGQLRLIRASTQFRAEFGWPPDSVIGWKDLQQFVHPDDREALSRAAYTTLREHIDLDLVVRTLWLENEPQWVALHCRAIGADDDTDCDLVIVARNVTAERHAAQELAEGERRRRFLLDLSARMERTRDPADLVRIASAGLSELMNAARAQLDDSANDAMAALPTGDVPLVACAAYVDIARAGQTIIIGDVANDSRAAGGCSMHLLSLGMQALVAVPLFRGGEWAATFIVVSERPRQWSTSEALFVESVARIVWSIYEKRRQETAHLQSKERLALAVEAAGLGVFEWDLFGGEMICSGEQCALFGMTCSDALARISRAEWLRRVHPADRARVERELEAALAAGGDLDSEYRIICAGEANVRWVRSIARLFPNEAGALARLIGITGDVTFYKETEERLESAALRERELRSAAEASNRAKDEFLSVISHELRSPLNAILGWNRILAVKRSSDPEVAAVTPRIERSARAQLKMVNDLLDFGRLGTGKLKIEPRPLRLTTVLGMALDAARPAAATAGIEILTDFDATQGEISGDPDRLQQVIGNLLSNAIKFTPSGGRVGVYLRRVGNMFELSVVDTGQGITPELLPHVFDRFRQGDSSTTKQASGLGLGLTLVREIIQLHGGTVTVRSEGSGRGSTFIVRLPMAGRAQTDANGAAGDKHASSNGDSQSLSGLTILVVDDEPDARTVVAETLRLEGACVTMSDSASSAYAQVLAKGAALDVIVTDIGMPDEDGYSLLRKVRQLPLGKHLPVIALTGYASKSDAQAALAAGFDLHVPKPVDFDTLLPLIRQVAPAPGAGEDVRGSGSPGKRWHVS